MKYEVKKVKKLPRYKYYKKNINCIVEKYTTEFQHYGIKFKYIPYKLKKR